jgi:hypothetical protein
VLAAQYPAKKLEKLTKFLSSLSYIVKPLISGARIARDPLHSLAQGLFSHRSASGSKLSEFDRGISRCLTTRSHRSRMLSYSAT